MQAVKEYSLIRLEKAIRAARNSKILPLTERVGFGLARKSWQSFKQMILDDGV